MFSLDDDTLEKGGEAILASKGDLGLLLFSASAGLAEISVHLQALRDKAGDIYHPRSSKTLLAVKKRELDALKAARDEADTMASAYAQLVDTRKSAEAAHKQALDALSRTRAEAQAIQRQLGALPHVFTLREVEAKLAPLADLYSAPATWRDEVQRLRGNEIRLAAQIDSADQAIRGLQEEFEAIALDPVALGVAASVDAWSELRSRFVTARDIPLRQGELAAKRDDLAAALVRLGRAGEAAPRRLLLPAHVEGEFRDLMEKRSGVEATLTGAEIAFEDATGDAAAAAQLAAGEGGEDRGAPIAALKTLLDLTRRDDSAQRAGLARASIAKQTKLLDEALRALAPWRGDAEGLAALPTPSQAEIAGLRDRWQRAGAKRDAARDALRAKLGELERAQAEAGAAARSQAMVGDDEAANVRAARDAAWAAHRAALDAPGADRFEALMRRDDDTGRARLAAASDLAAQREREIKRAGLEADCACLKTDLGDVEAALHDAENAVAAAAPVAPPAGREALSFLADWLLRRGEALAIRKTLAEACEDLRRAESDAKQARADLSGALRAADVAYDADGDFATLAAAARGALDRENERKTLNANAEEKRKAAERAAGNRARALAADKAWRVAWRAACAACWLGEDGAEPSIGAVRQSLSALEDMRIVLNQYDDLAHRIAAMERDRAAFANEVAAVAGRLGETERADDVASLAAAIETRVKICARHPGEARGEEGRLARSAEAARDAGRRARRKRQACRGDDERVWRGDARRCRAEARGLPARATRCVTPRKEPNGRFASLQVAATLEAARALLAGVDREALETRLAALQARESGETSANAQAFSALSEANRRLAAVGGDDAVARMQEKRRTILEEIGQGAETYLRLKFGVAAADEALRLYRDRHRGAMMTRASEAFRLISRGAYRGLTTQPNGAGETLIALGADGGSKEADQLSKGARFQLYLALRVAGYHEFAKARRPAPFMADDIMETFDHFRAEEALRLFADMARVGQVIYFTHHLHLCEIARNVCPQARVHQLTG